MKAAPHIGAEQTPYSGIRESIQTGDVLLFRGASLLSRVIQWGSNSVYSHAGFAAWWGGRLLAFQSVAGGTEVLPLSTVVGAYDGRVDLWRLTESARAEVNLDVLVDHAVVLLGRRYATGLLWGLMWRMARQRFRGRRDVKREPTEVFCSQYVSYCFRRAGLDLVRSTDDASTSPGDLARSKHLRLEAVLRDDPRTQTQRMERLGTRTPALVLPRPR